MMWTGHSPIRAGLTPAQAFDAFITERVAEQLALRFRLARFNARPVAKRRRSEAQPYAA